MFIKRMFGIMIIEVHNTKCDDIFQSMSYKTVRKYLNMNVSYIFYEESICSRTVNRIVDVITLMFGMD